ncbi:MAG: carboxymuconolactone decarboxylase family protein [Candidatus Obscuribacterales bacterium]
MRKIPQRYLNFQKAYPDVFKAYEALGKAASSSGPLSNKEMALIKLAIASGARLEGAVHSHCRRALDAGCTAAEIRQTVLLTTTTIGFPSMMACLSWVDDIIDGNSKNDPS